jgi:hypothetical protein
MKKQQLLRRIIWRLLGENAVEHSYAPAADRNGKDLHPGDFVRFKTYPKGTAEGVVVVSNRAREVMPDGSTLPALVIMTDDGILYSLHSKGTLKLSKA